MHLGIIPDNPLEKLVLALNVAPEPIVHTQMAFTMARTIMAATELGVFDILNEGSMSSADVAKRAKTNPRATEIMLRALVGLEYLKLKAELYSLSPMAKKWLVKSSPHSIANKMIFQKLEWEYVHGLPEFIRTGKPLELHSSESKEAWELYQGGMVDIGKLALGEMQVRTPIPKGATEMLDIGGSGGTYSAAFVRRHKGLRSTILELPAAYEFAKPMVDDIGLGDSVRIQQGNVLEDDLGQSKYDAIFMSNVAHHFSAEQNIAVAIKCARALKPGGRFIIQETSRSETPTRKNQMGVLLDLYFALTSASGTWTVKEMSAWIGTAGLKLGKTVYARSAPGLVQVWGERV
jgi:2-polyprenyl-3-methyl-5-hydroxy-6-metoxy-1,4-benzoquinol methylase